MKINEVHKLLISAGNDWAHFFTYVNHMRSSTLDGPCITWRKYIPGMMIDHPVRVSHVAELIEKEQYSFRLLDDNSILQFYYQYNPKGDTLLSACLAFYKVQPDKLKKGKKQKAASEKPEGDQKKEDNIIAADIADDASISWLRIDYAPQADQGVLHHACHMHTNSFPNGRAVVNAVPNPAQFIELIVSWYYPEAYQKHRLDGSGKYKNLAKIADLNDPCFSASDCSFLQHVAHFRIPTTERRK